MDGTFCNTKIGEGRTVIYDNEITRCDGYQCVSDQWFRRMAVVVVYISDTNAIQVASTIGRTKLSSAIRRSSLLRTCGDIAVGHQRSDPLCILSILSPRITSFAHVHAIWKLENIPRSWIWRVEDCMVETRMGYIRIWGMRASKG